MPVCQGCGGSYDNDFKFCPYCARPKPEPTTINVKVTPDDLWETCEITLVQLSLFKMVFEATAIGPQGRYAAACSEPLSYGLLNSDWKFGDNDEVVPVRHKTQPKLDALIKNLVADGWRPTGRGQGWYSERFRRQVKD